ncbi:TolC family outer membrane protein [Larsenimonas rhizosphaerae]|uniref:TolC family outer membrane protein n=1 Tax=Larsenimonas rhizosphaerae TaxID=2944682 RepID=UPI0020337477|nr:TolC family outer membrane protein [Larsenimonas rhizosphaerae]MCM2131813.1 TolC family outer membrane protein [Larsenimonas rhizosphaerae]
MPRMKSLPLAIALVIAVPAHAADLMTITQDALSNNAGYNASRATYDSTRANEDIERGDLLPQVSATASYTQTHTLERQRASTGGAGAAGAGGVAGAGAAGAGASDDNYGTTSAALQVTQTLFDATNWYQLEAAERSSLQQSLSLAGDRQQLMYNVAEAYFEVLRANELLETYKAQERALNRELEQVQQQFNVGVVAITDVRSAESSYDSARAQRIAQESTVEVNFEALEQLTGRQYASIDSLKQSLPIRPPRPASRDAWSQMASSQNISLLAARVGVEAARSDVKTARAGHLPTIEAFANYDYSRSNADYLRGHGEDTQVGIQASLPIYSGGSTSARVRYNTYLLEESQFNAENELRTAVQNARSYYAQVNNAIYSIAARKKAIQSAKSSLDATRQGYQVGTYNIVDVLDAEENLYTSISDYADARYDYILDMLNLRQASGVLDLGTLQALNKWLDAANPVAMIAPDRQNDKDLLAREIDTDGSVSDVFGNVEQARLDPVR